MTLLSAQVPRRAIASRQMPTLSLVGLVAGTSQAAFTPPQRVKSLAFEIESLLVKSIKESITSNDLSIVRARDFDLKILPTIAVGVASVSSIPDAPKVKRLPVDIVFASNECTPEELDAISEKIEFEMIYRATEESVRNEGFVIYDITYGGSYQEWDGTILLVNFSLEVLAAKT